MPVKNEPKGQVSELPSFKLGLNKWQAQVIHIGFWSRLLTLTAGSSAVSLEATLFLKRVKSRRGTFVYAALVKFFLL
ncbi:hypothetical protein [Enterococcus rivorum]|uniref:Uncharacterized protein n=1 Tax=Enterococcus rivorum TaxID=762845 RepID=A0A1E5KZD0_9ENTE|nr:hypothetical protein [Enterococcus rivorum]OEH83174.1 hypothetical protein BCR26_10880 [Enterococcus rivorum]